MSKTKKKSSAAKKAAIFFAVIIIIEILAMVGISRVFKNDDVTPSIAGYSVFLMDSNRMGDAVPKNSLVLAENVSPSKDKIGKAVLCENVPSIGTSVFWLQDVVAKGDNVDGVIYKVYQGNDSENVYEVKAKDVVGVATTNYITAGKAIKFVTSYIGMAICIIIPLLLLAIIEIIIAIATHSSSRDGDNEYEEDDEEENTLEDFLNEDARFAAQNINSDEDDYDINFGTAADENSEETDIEDDNIDTDETYEDDLNVDVSEAEEIEEQEPEVKPQPRDAEESVSSTRKTASASLEELMKMMEEEQQKLREQLNK